MSWVRYLQSSKEYLESFYTYSFSLGQNYIIVDRARICNLYRRYHAIPEDNGFLCVCVEMRYGGLLGIVNVSNSGGLLA